MKRILVWLLFTAPLSAETLIYDHKVGMFVLTEAACSESFEGAAVEFACYIPEPNEVEYGS